MNRISLVAALAAILALSACSSTYQGARSDANKIGEYIDEKVESF